MYLSKGTGDDDKSGSHDRYRKGRNDPSTRRPITMNASNEIDARSKRVPPSPPPPPPSSSSSRSEHEPHGARRQMDASMSASEHQKRKAHTKPKVSSSFLDELEKLNAEIKAEEEEGKKSIPRSTLHQSQTKPQRGQSFRRNNTERTNGDVRISNYRRQNMSDTSTRTDVQKTSSNNQQYHSRGRIRDPVIPNNQRGVNLSGNRRRDAITIRRRSQNHSRSEHKVDDTRGTDKEPFWGNFGEYLEGKTSDKSSRSLSKPTENRKKNNDTSFSEGQDTISVKSSISTENSRGRNRKKPLFWEELEQMVPAQASPKSTKTPLANVKSTLFLEYLEKQVSAETSKSSKPRYSQGGNRRPSFLSYAEQKVLTEPSKSSEARCRPQVPIQRRSRRENARPKRSVETQKLRSQSKHSSFDEPKQRPTENAKSDENLLATSVKIPSKASAFIKNDVTASSLEPVNISSRTKSTPAVQSVAFTPTQSVSRNKEASAAQNRCEAQLSIQSLKTKVFRKENNSTLLTPIKAQPVSSVSNRKTEEDLSEQSFSESNSQDAVEEKFEAFQDFVSDFDTEARKDFRIAKKVEENKTGEEEEEVETDEGEDAIIEEEDEIIEEEDEEGTEEDEIIEEDEAEYEDESEEEEIIEEEEYDTEEEDDDDDDEIIVASSEEIPVHDESKLAWNKPLHTTPMDDRPFANFSEHTHRKSGPESSQARPSSSHPPCRAKRDLVGAKSGTESFDDLPTVASASPVSFPVSQQKKSLIEGNDVCFDREKEDTVKEFTELLEVVQGNEIEKIVFYVGEDITRFLVLLKKFQEYLEVLEPGLQIIAELANIDTYRDALASQGCIEFVLVAMLQHEWDLLLQERGCNVLATLAKTEKYNEWIVESNGIELLVAVQSAYATEIKIQLACLRAIHNLARNNKKNTFTIAAKGGLNSLMAVVKMPEHCRDLEFQKEAMAYMATLCRTNDWNRGAIAARGGLQTTLEALKTLPDKDLQAVGYDTLFCLSSGHAHNTDNIVANGGIEMMVRSMKMNEFCLPLQESGVRLAKLLTERSEMTKHFVNAGGIEIILIAMRTFEDSQIIQDVGCSVLLNMSMHPENKDTMCALGCSNLIIRVMKTLSEDPNVQKTGCKALESLASSDKNKKSVAFGGGISAIISAMQVHTGVPALQGLAVSALRKLATIPCNRDAMTEGNCIAMVEQAMEKNPTNIFLLDNGKHLLSLLDPLR